MTKIPVGVIGTGFIGPAHIEALRRLPGVEVVALADVDEATAKAKAASLGVAHAYGDYKKLLERDDVRAVHICSPNYLHFEMTRRALEAGKHVVCEKPLAVEEAEAAALVSLAAEKKLVNAVHFNVRYYPLMRQVKQMALKGELGDIFSIHGSYLQDWLYYATDYNWRLEPKLSGRSRAVADIGSHWMDLIEYISGLRIVEVFADFATFHPTRKKPLKPVETYAGKVLQPGDYAEVPISTEDYATILFRFHTGARGALTVSQVSAGRKNRISFEIDGSRRAVAWESEAPNSLWIGRRDGNNEVMMKDPSLVYPEVRSLISFPGGHNEAFPDTSKQMFREIYDHIGGGAVGQPTFPTFKDGLRELTLCEKILSSNEQRAWARVQEKGDTK
ncbi:MAG: Gfo/Idh/MocA family oxidoreductase [Spirochaetia bacterium]|jgi:predicted dehydrogenase